MTQQVVRAKVALPTLDVTMYKPTMDFIFEQLGTNTNVNLADCDAKIEAFFNSEQTGQTQTMAYYMSPVLSRGANAVQIEYYDITAHLNGSAAGSPIGITNFTLGAAANSAPLPEEIATVFAYKADYGLSPEKSGNTRPRARKRGRFYFGPLNLAVSNESGSTNGFIWDPTYLSNAKKAFLGLLSHSGSTDNTAMVQWSRMDAQVNQIVHGAIDPGADIRRKRRPYTADLVWDITP